MKRGRTLFLLALVPLTTVVLARVLLRDRLEANWKKAEKARVATWNAVATVPIGMDRDIADHIAAIPLACNGAMETDKLVKLRKAVERFVAYARENTFSHYWEFRVQSPYEEVCIPANIKEFMGKYFPQERLTGSPSNQLKVVFDSLSFGTDRDHWAFEKVNYTNSLITVQTNTGTGSLLEQVMTREFPTGYLLRTNVYFHWLRPREKMIAEDANIEVATVRLFLSSAKTGVGHAYPVYLALIWDREQQSWIPEELGASGNPPPIRSLFF